MTALRWLSMNLPLAAFLLLSALLPLARSQDAVEVHFSVMRLLAADAAALRPAGGEWDGAVVQVGALRPQAGLASPK